MIHLIGITAPDVDELVAKVTEHLPVGAALGRVRVAQGRPMALLLVDYGDSGAALYGVDLSGAFRIVEVGHDLAEVTTWRNGREISRCIRRAET